MVGGVVMSNNINKISKLRVLLRSRNNSNCIESPACCRHKENFSGHRRPTLLRMQCLLEGVKMSEMECRLQNLTECVRVVNYSR